MNLFRCCFPLLWLDVRVPFMGIRTALVYERIEVKTIEYILIYIDIWKWNFHFSIYNRVHDK